MKIQDGKIAILKATIDLLKENDDIDRVTVRDIVDRADVNLSMVNYYFGSKDNLMLAAVSKIMEDASFTAIKYEDVELPPRERLAKFIFTMGNVVAEYKKYTKPIIPRVLLNDKISLPNYILPMVRECLSEKDESYCKIVAYELIVMLQVAFYRSDDFNTYCGIDLDKKIDRERFLNIQMNILLGDD